MEIKNIELSQGWFLVIEGSGKKITVKHPAKKTESIVKITDPLLITYSNPFIISKKIMVEVQEILIKKWESYVFFNNPHAKEFRALPTGELR